jgi:hypothetical protein
MPRLRWAVVLWLLIVAGVGLRVALAARPNGVYPIFSAAGRHWLAREPVYVPPTVELDVYRYSPPVAAFFGPWSLISDRWAGVLWRFLNASVFLGGLAAWCRHLRPAVSVAGAFLLVIPIALGGLNSGQCNALMVGLLLFAHVALLRQLWTVASVCIAVPVFLKGYPLALGMLFCLVEPRRLSPRLASCLLIGAALPYLTQRWDYVNGQYAEFFQRLCEDDRTAYGVSAGYRDLHMLVRIIGVPMGLGGYRLLEAALGFACAAGIVIGQRRGWASQTALAACFALGSCWMTLAGPATESSTYVLVAPALAHAMLNVAARPMRQRLLVGTSFALFTVASASVWFPGHIAGPIQRTGIQPLAALLLTIHVVNECSQAMRRPTVKSRVPAEKPLAA